MQNSERYPNQNNQMITRSMILILIVAFILLISIVLLLIIGLKSNNKTSQIESYSLLNSSVKSLYFPCECGCPSIKPLFNNKNSTRGRIINGEMAHEHSWPWEMFLLIIDFNRNPISYCSATLITDRHILTAAHCVHHYIPPFIYLFPGQNNFHLNISLTSGYRVHKMYIHEGFNVLLHNDIAILTVEQSLRFDSYIQPICLSKPSSSILKVNEELISIGWGRLSSEPGTIIYPENLQQVKVLYIPTSDPTCSQIFHPIMNVHPGQMCAGRKGFNLCQGDSGGPLMRKVSIPNRNNSYWEQIGIASKTIDCGWNSTWPDIYINIQYYYQWIIQTIERSR